MASRPSKRRRLSPSPSTNNLDPDDDANVVNEAMHMSRQVESDGFGSDAQEGENDSGAADGNTSEEDSSEEKKHVKPVSRPMRSTMPRLRNGVTRSGRETSTTNILKLQVEEMLRQITPIYGKKEAPAEDMLRRLKEVIEKIPDRDALPVQEAEMQLLKSHKIAVPFPSPRPSAAANYKLAFAKPSSINVAGSYAMKTATRVEGTIAIDLLVNMPPSLFTEKDCLDYRYFYKRAYYLACIAAGIQDSFSVSANLSFSSHQGNPLLPTLLVQSKGDDDFARSSCDVHIMPAMSEHFFPLARTLPFRSCIRSALSKSQNHESDPPPTPFYNASVRADSSITSYLKLLHGAIVMSTGFRDACLLGRVWLRQRGLGATLKMGGFGHFEWAALVALLLQGGGLKGKPVLLPTYDGFQLFRATLQFLATHNLVKQAVLVDAEHVGFDKPNDLPIMFDGVRGMNILYKMTPWSYRTLQKESQVSVNLLNSGSDDLFDSLFILKVDEPLMQYDLLGNFASSNSSRGITGSENDSEPTAQSRRLYEVLLRGLGNRVRHIRITQSDHPSWSVNTAKPRKTASEKLSFGVILDSNNASRTVDRGPSTEDHEVASSFREYWGDKAELRRFKDGQILESVVWEDADPISMTQNIIRYILEKHLEGKGGDSYKFLGNDFKSAHQDLVNTNASTAPFERNITTYRILDSQIRSLEGLPLQVRQIQASGADLRYASIIIPWSRDHDRLQPADIVIQFEGSGRWPDNLSAIQVTKIAFLLKISELLSGTKESLITRLGLENERQDILNRSFLDVLYPSGAAFRLRIHHEREQTLIERQLSDKSLSPREREEAAMALANYKRIFIRTPLLTQAMQKLATRFPALPPTIRVMKTWFRAHLLSDHLPEELIEMIVARTFLQPQPWQPPSSAMTAFLRTLLFLARWDWQNDPLLLDFSGSIKPAEIAATRTRFDAWRKIDPSLNRVILFVATNFDPDGTTWTEHRPAKVVAGRMSGLARAACKVVREQGLELELASLFKSPLKDFDFIVHLDARFARGRQSEATQSRFQNLRNKGNSDGRLLSYDSVQLFLEELQSLYGESIVFFHDSSRRAIIAGLWSPHTAPRRWKVNLPYSTVPLEVDGEDEGAGASVNKASILSEIAKLGGDMVSRVESGA